MPSKSLCLSAPPSKVIAKVGIAWCRTNRNACPLFRHPLLGLTVPPVAASSSGNAELKVAVYILFVVGTTVCEMFPLSLRSSTRIEHPFRRSGEQSAYGVTEPGCQKTYG